jgi:hypothetical protein
MIQDAIAIGAMLLFAAILCAVQSGQSAVRMSYPRATYYGFCRLLPSTRGKTISRSCKLSAAVRTRPTLPRCGHAIGRSLRGRQCFEELDAQSTQASHKRTSTRDLSAQMLPSVIDGPGGWRT